MTEACLSGAVLAGEVFGDADPIDKRGGMATLSLKTIGALRIGLLGDDERCVIQLEIAPHTMAGIVMNFLQLGSDDSTESIEALTKARGLVRRAEKFLADKHL